MCGIAGALRLGAQSEIADQLPSLVSKMSDAIAHRGPDDAGIWADSSQTICLGHRRLSIVDLSERGHQPMHFRNRYVIAFNGEIYNFRELRSELVRAGHAFVSGTDTELIMAAVCEWGIQRALERMVGMFAFALWDAVNRELHLVRDRLGEKPLYLSVHDRTLFFGSELHSLEAIPGVCSTLSRHAVARYLRHGYVPAPLSMYENVFKLPQACWLRVRAQAAGQLSFDSVGGELTVREADLTRYWRIGSRGPQCQSPDESAVVDQLQALLRDSVRGQMQADVPIGVFLSGGVDSTVVAAVAQELSAGPISTYTVKFDVPGFDESAHAAAIARHLGTRHQEISLVPASLLAAIPSHAADMDEPTANASYFPLRMMASAARNHVKVVLSGDAGDELFGGYNRYRLTPPLWRRFAWLPTPVRRLFASGARAVPHSVLNALKGRAGVSGQIELATSLKKIGRFLDADSLGESYQRLLRCWDSSTAIAELEDPIEASLHCDESGFLNAATAFDLEHYLPDDNLAKSDRATMAAGLEQRVPLLDHRIVEFARGLPDPLLIRDGTSKWVLRQLAYRYVPNELLDRPKMGFTVPVRDWLCGPLRPWAGDLLHSDPLLELGMLKKAEVKRHWSRLQQGDTSMSWEMWALVIYTSWLSSRLGHAASARRVA